MTVTTKRNIRRSVGFDSKEMKGYFMIAKEDAALAIVNKLTGTQLRLWLYLMMVDSFADSTTNGEKVYHSIPSPQEIAIKIGASPETVEKDIRKLKKLGLYDYRVTAWRGHNLSAARARGESDRLKRKKAKTKSPQSEGLNKPPESLNKPPESLNKPFEGLNKPPESLNKPSENPEIPEKSTTSDVSQTLQTYTDFKKTLSEDERENFLEFVREQIHNLERPINDLEAWLASKNAAEQNRWEIYYKNYQAQKFEQKPRNTQKTSRSGNSTREKNLAIAEFRKRMKLNEPEPKTDSEEFDSNEPELKTEPEETNSCQTQWQKTEFDELLDDSLGIQKKSSTQRRKEQIAEARQKRQELKQKNQDLADERAKQLDPDLEKRKAEMLRQVEEYKQFLQQQNLETDPENPEIDMENN